MLIGRYEPRRLNMIQEALIYYALQDLALEGSYRDRPIVIDV